jgi:hypothetical protein
MAVTYRTVTSANAVVMLTVPTLYDSPQQLQGFAPDQMFDVPDITNKELQFGADGVLTAGFVFVPVEIDFKFLASSLSVPIFETWANTEREGPQVLPCSLTISLPATSTIYTLTQGYLMKASPVPTAQKVLQPRSWGVAFGQCAISPSA